LFNYSKTEESSEILEEVMSLPVKYRTVIHLFYIEGYKTDEISDILSISSSTVRKRLQYAREKLRFQYEKGDLA
jgi:RNA polymerase sigma factor, sigma-70 family